MTSLSKTEGVTIHPMQFGEPGDLLFGWYYPGDGPIVRDCGILICSPPWYERSQAHWTCVSLAHRLSSVGFPVLRFDLHGAGDSSGDDRDPASVRTWRADIAAAIDALKVRSRAAEIGVVGLRFSAALAAVTAAELGSIGSLVLWSPYPSGAACLRDMRILGKITRARRGGAPGGAGAEEEVLGVSLTRELIRDLEEIDLSSLRTSPARRVLVLGGGDASPERRLSRHLEGLRADVVYSCVPGHLSWLGDIQRSSLPEAALDAIESWLCTGYPPAAVPLADPARTAAVPEARAPGGLVAMRRGALPIREEPLLMDAQERLFGILVEPPGGSRAGRHGIIFQSALGDASRLHVDLTRRWAAMGALSLRMHRERLMLRGAAPEPEKDPRAGDAVPRALIDESIFEGRAAMDAVGAARGVERFVLIGLCVGAVRVLHTALVDPRVVEIIMINPPGGDFVDGSNRDLHEAIFIADRLRKGALFNADAWKRAIRGEIALKGLGSAMFSFAKRAVRQRLGGQGTTRASGVARALEALVDRGVSAFVLYGEEDGALQHRALHLGESTRKVGPGGSAVRVEIIRGASHTLLESQEQQRVERLLTERLRTRYF